MSYKWHKRLESVYPIWAKETHQRWLNGEFPDEEFGFYDEENDCTTRSLIVFEDNAPYHHGVQINLANKSKLWLYQHLKEKMFEVADELGA